MGNRKIKSSDFGNIWARMQAVARKKPECLTNAMIAIDPHFVQWASAFANCAIEGNAEAGRMMQLWHTDKKAFASEVINRWDKQRE